jgi:hypothetical protein
VAKVKAGLKAAEKKVTRVPINNGSQKEDERLPLSALPGRSLAISVKCIFINATDIREKRLVAIAGTSL